MAGAGWQGSLGVICLGPQFSLLLEFIGSSACGPRAFPLQVASPRGLHRSLQQRIQTSYTVRTHKHTKAEAAKSSKVLGPELAQRHFYRVLLVEAHHKPRFKWMELNKGVDQDGGSSRATDPIVHHSPSTHC